MAALGVTGCVRPPGHPGPCHKQGTQFAPPSSAPEIVRDEPQSGEPLAIGDAEIHPIPEDKPAADLGTCHLLVLLAPGTAARDLAGRHDLTWVRTLQSDADMHVLAAPSEEAARQALFRLQSDPAVRSAYLDVQLPRVPRPLQPDSSP